MSALKIGFWSLCLVSVQFCSAAIAGPLVSGGTGPLKTYASCRGKMDDGVQVSFVIRSTAAPTYQQGLIELNNASREALNLECKNVNQPISKVPSAGKVLWKCEELRDGEGKVSVVLTRGGVTGVTTGQIFQEQMFPLSPALIGSLACGIR